MARAAQRNLVSENKNKQTNKKYCLMQLSYMVFTSLLANKDLRKICSLWGQRNFPVYESFSGTTGEVGLEAGT